MFRGTIDGRVIALAAETGRVLWGAPAVDPDHHQAFVSAPIARQGKVFIGIGISDDGIAGRLMALDAGTGNELWRFQTTL